MTVEIRFPEIYGVTESELALGFEVWSGDAQVDAEASVLLDGEECARDARIGTRHHRITGLDADREYRIEIRSEGGIASVPGRYFPERVRTLPAARAAETARFATLNDLHFGEPKVGGELNEEMEAGDEEKPGFPLMRAEDTDVPYWRFMNEDAIDEINRSGVDCTIIKGDIADSGDPWQFEEAARAFARFEKPHHALLGNHDYYARTRGLEIDGYSMLGQPASPRSLDLGGWRLLLLETALPGEHHGWMPDERLEWLAAQLTETREARLPTLMLMHHQPVPHEHRERWPNPIGIDPDQSLTLFSLLGDHPQLRGVLIGHTHRNRVHRNAASGELGYVEVHCTKDYPGGWAHYRLFEDGSFRQEVRRTASERALTHSSRCGTMYRGGYRDFALGQLAERSFEVGPPSY